MRPIDDECFGEYLPVKKRKPISYAVVSQPRKEKHPLLCPSCGKEKLTNVKTGNSSIRIYGCKNCRYSNLIT